MHASMHAIMYACMYAKKGREREERKINLHFSTEVPEFPLPLDYNQLLMLSDNVVPSLQQLSSCLDILNKVKEQTS